MSISKIHLANSTGLSLSDRFTAIAHKPETQYRARSRSRSQTRSAVHREAPASFANRRLLEQLARKDKLQAALKLKRRSMRTAGTSASIRRPTVNAKAIRLSANGRPIKTRSLAKVATMRADYVAATNGGNSRRGAPLRRSNSTAALAGRLGGRGRPTVGGAAERVARRRLGSAGDRGAALTAVPRGRSRSRSRGRALAAPPAAPARGRSRSRSRGRNAQTPRKSAVPIKARLGVRPGEAKATGAAGARPRGRAARAASVSRRGVQQGRVQKRTGPAKAAPAGQKRGVALAGGRVSRARASSAVRNTVRGRSRSRGRGGAANATTSNQNGQRKQRSGSVGRQQQPRRGRSAQRRPAGAQGKVAKNGKQQQQQQGGRRGQQKAGQPQQQQRRGRTRSRAGGRSQGKGKGNNTKTTPVKREDLDKELDQYMATTKTENNLDYLLKN